MIALALLLAADLLAPGAKLEKVVGDLQFSEGPAWHPDGYLLFEDIPRNRILRLNADGTSSVHREPSGRANGLTFDGKGQLIAAEGATPGGGRRISRMEKDGTIVTVADRHQGKRLNSPNDLTIDRRGRIYFTDPRYGDRADVEQDKESVYRVDPDGKVTRVIDDVVRPNGIALSSDDRTLFVVDNSDTALRALLAYDLGADGSATRRRVLFDFGAGRGGDGMTVDREGRLWITAGTKAEGGVHVFSIDRARTKATRLTIVATPENATNCTFGGKNRDWLYITTATSLYRIQTKARGRTGLPGK